MPDLRPKDARGRNRCAAPVWAVLRAADEPLGIADIARRARLNDETVGQRLRYWARAGLVKRSGDVRPCYQLAPGAPLSPPTVSRRGTIGQRSTARDRMWRAIRIMGQFDLPGLAMTAEVTRSAAQVFVTALRRAGWLRTLRRGSARHGEWSVYMLIRNPGRLTPVVAMRRTPDGVRSEVVDPNTGERFALTPDRRRAAGRPSAAVARSADQLATPAEAPHA